MTCEPDIELLKSFLERLFEFLKELFVIGSSRHIDEQPDQFVVITLLPLLPGPDNHLAFGGNGAKTSFQARIVFRKSGAGTGRPSLNRRGNRIS